MELYCGIDLHSNNSYIVVLEAGGRRHFARRLPNDLAAILEALAPFQAELTRGSTARVGGRSRST